MRISSVIGLYFSPTGTTRTLVTAAAEQAAQTLGVPFRLISLNTPAERETAFHFSADTLVIVGAPTYAGRLPNKISPDLRRILHGSGSPAVALVTYGNRAYENALAELFRVLTDGGMKPAAGAVCVCQHSIARALAAGRPNAEGLRRGAPLCCQGRRTHSEGRDRSPLPCRATQTAAIISRPARAGSPRNFSSLHRRPILKKMRRLRPLHGTLSDGLDQQRRSVCCFRYLHQVPGLHPRLPEGVQNFSTTNSFCPMRACLNRSLPGYIRKTSFICKKERNLLPHGFALSLFSPLTRSQYVFAVCSVLFGPNS